MPAKASATESGRLAEPSARVKFLVTSRAARTHIFLGKCQNPRKHSFCRSWLYRVKSQIYLSHFFLSPIWCTELKSEKIQWKCQCKKQPLLFDCFAAYRAWKEVDNMLWDPFRQGKCGGCFLNWYFEQLSLDLWSEYEMWMRKKWLTKIWWPFLETLQYSQLLFLRVEIGKTDAFQPPGI